MPSLSTVMGWLFDGEHEEFSEQYARAREVQAEVLADELTDIADDASGDTTMGEKGRVITDHEHIQRSRLRIDTRKWIASKLLPKRYGDKIVQEHTGPDGGPVVIDDVSTLELAMFIGLALRKAAKIRDSKDQE